MLKFRYHKEIVEHRRIWKGSYDQMKRNFFISTVVLLFLLIVASYSLFFSAQRPLIQAEKEARIIARDTADMIRFEDFYWYNGTQGTFFTVAGWDEADRYLYVIIKQDGGDTTILDSREVVTEEEAKSITQAAKAPARILEARLGVGEDIPFWEVTYKREDGSLAYVAISALTAEVLHEYGNLD